MLKYHIQTIEVGSGGASSIIFNNIPQDYDDLLILTSIRESGTSVYTVSFTFNTSSASFTEKLLQGNGSSAISASTSYGAVLSNPTGVTSDTFASGQIYISNYTSLSNKSYSVDSVLELNQTEAYQRLTAGLWSTTEAITRVSINGSIAQYSSASLYGIKYGTSGEVEVASGGTISYSGGYTIHTFNSSGTFVANRDLDVEYLVVAGGGGGGDHLGGGGGAGGYRCSVEGESSGGGASAEPKLRVTSGESYLVQVGSGGSGGTDRNRGGQGVSSSFASIVALGGGGGGGLNSGQRDGGSGGSGGGNSGEGTNVSGAGTEGQGFAGSSTASEIQAGGGGGAGAVGATLPDVTSQGKDGGDGVQSNITGTLTYRAGGGGGSQDTFNQSNQGDGGLGGGGNGSTGASSGSAGSVNTGGGGGGSGNNGQTGANGGAGGSGVVIIRYLTPA